MRLLFISILAVIATALALSPRASAAAPEQAHLSPIVVTAQQLDIKFPRSMNFTISAKSDSNIQVLRLTVWQRGVAAGSRFSPRFIPASTVNAAFDWNFQSNVFGGYLPPGTHGEYTWHIEDAAGNSYDTPHEQYVVVDRTQQWQTISNSNLNVNWNTGDASFGAAVLQRAIAARVFLTGQLKIDDTDPLEIYIYGDRQNFMESLPAFSHEWTGGETFPEYGVIMINFPPDNLDWGLRATSHELSHAILHAKIRGPLGELSLPLWLDEGLAVYNQTNDHAPDSQFEATFQTALSHNTLITLRTLEQRFPNDSDQAELAYGESYNVVKFMIENYGADQFAKLLDVYQKGSLPDDALTQVYGLNQDALENAWRKKIGAPLRQFSNSVLPTVAPRPTYEFSSPLTSDTPTSSAPAPTNVSENATALPNVTAPASQPEFPTTGVCGGALAFIGLIAFSRIKKKL